MYELYREEKERDPMNRLKKLRFVHVGLFLLLAFSVVLYLQYKAIEPLRSLRGYYSDLTIKGHPYEMSFDYGKEGMYYFKSPDTFEEGTYEKVGSNQWLLTPGNIGRIITTDAKGFAVFDEKHGRVVNLQYGSDIPSWIQQPWDKERKVSAPDTGP